MMGVFQRRQLFVHPVQYWFVVTTLMYFACLLIVLYAVVFLPIAQPLYDSSVSWEQHAQIATQFLELNERIWPWLIVTFLVLLLHSMYFMHRIAGPLYRFSTLFRSIGTGHLHQRARLRKHDYLHREAQAFNSMLDNLENRIQTINLHSALVTQAYEAVALQAQEQSSGQINAALQTLDEEIRRFKTCLAEFDLKTEKLSEQQRLQFADTSSTDTSPAIKAA
ncbi:MAG: methyl-accepting chemotaxis protein [Nitrospira sp.]|nr:methyl-accepting chemotaxis protein [Nitrospira sp.]MDH4370197.1 methyl-accepting chemotaxis protein [Nitrospira sp.]MDH5498042.1 methyl-accepting chemotaxis protein [Nitrospira sp.]MDH5727357.1 methyl-accepting chemotaxis protein [Nitrospira sp.]